MNGSDPTRFELPAAYSSLEALGERLRATLARIDGLPEPDVTIYNIQLAADEIFANIAGHAYEDRADGWVSVSLAFDAASRRFMVELHDTGAPFDPSSVPAPDLDTLSEGGYGLFLAQTLMDDVIYTTRPDGNCWLLIKQL
jgi:anti-sigma regulatory factor (Ser/Thr protein kinase)